MSTVRKAARPAKAPRKAREVSLGAQVFAVAADRLAKRSADAALFTETGRSWQPWFRWEVLAGCLAAGWTGVPEAAYGQVGVAGSREKADLLVFDPATGHRVIVELTIIHDWSTNKWIADLNGDTERLRKAAAVGVAGLQLIVAASLVSAVEVNDTWKGWLAMSRIWSQPTDMKQALPLGAVGQMLVYGWAID